MFNITKNKKCNIKINDKEIEELKIKYENTERELLSRTEKLRKCEIENKELRERYNKLLENYDIITNK